MVASMVFQGFQPGLIEFLRRLRENNDRDWFQAHRGEYEALLLAPAREFVLAMGDCMKQLGPDMHAEPKIRGSILAINRDTRFSADKSPYKSHLDLWFWQGSGPSRERPGYFFRLTPEQLTLGAGMHRFSDAVLDGFRAAVLDDAHGSRLEALVEPLKSDSSVRLGEQTLKRVPSGWPADHPRAEFLRFTGLSASSTMDVPPELCTPQLPAFCLQHFQRFADLQRWLIALPALDSEA